MADRERRKRANEEQQKHSEVRREIVPASISLRGKLANMIFSILGCTVVSERSVVLPVESLITRISRQFNQGS